MYNFLSTISKHAKAEKVGEDYQTEKVLNEKNEGHNAPRYGLKGRFVVDVGEKRARVIWKSPD